MEHHESETEGERKIADYYEGTDTAAGVLRLSVHTQNPELKGRIKIHQEEEEEKESYVPYYYYYYYYYYYFTI